MKRKAAPSRVTKADRFRHFLDESVETRRVIEALRAAVLRAAPKACEAFKFHVLCYYHADAYFGSIGGNICMIEVKKGLVMLSFMFGAMVSDPSGMLSGKGKFKRFVPVPNVQAAASREVKELVRAATRVRAWEHRDVFV